MLPKKLFSIIARFYLSGNWSNSDGFSEWFTVNNGVESVDWVSGVVYGSTVTVGINERVATLDNISWTSFLLVLGITSQWVLYNMILRINKLSKSGMEKKWLMTHVNVIAEAVLWVWIVFFGLFGKNWSGDLVNNWSRLNVTLLNVSSRLSMVNGCTSRLSMVNGWTSRQ